MATKKNAETVTEAPEAPVTEAPASEAAAPKASPLKKITIQTVAGKIKDWFRTNREKIVAECVANEAGTVPICRIWGKVVKTSAGSSTYGDFVRFQGQFFGISALDGKYYSAGQCLLPKWLEMEVDAAYSENGDTVYFGYDIYLKIAPDASLGYEFVADRLTEPKTDMSVIEEQFPALPPRIETLMLAAPDAK